MVLDKRKVSREKKGIITMGQKAGATTRVLSWQREYRSGVNAANQAASRASAQAQARRGRGGNTGNARRGTTTGNARRRRNG